MEAKMAKKILIGLTMAALVAGGAFAQNNPVSFGVGTSFMSDFGGGWSFDWDNPGTGFTETRTVRTPNSGFGGHIFVDAFYAAISVGFFSTNGRWEDVNSNNNPANTQITGSALDQNMGALTTFSGAEATLMGKYPIEITPRVTVFPLLALSYKAVLTANTVWEEGRSNAGVYSYTHQVHQNPSDFSALWFKLGLGMDFGLNEANSTFIRGTISYGARLRNDFERQAINDGASGRLGHGVDVALSLGFK